MTLGLSLHRLQSADVWIGKFDTYVVTKHIGTNLVECFAELTSMDVEPEPRVIATRDVVAAANGLSGIGSVRCQ